jgi:hypothetical protein
MNSNRPATRGPVFLCAAPRRTFCAAYDDDHVFLRERAASALVQNCGPHIHGTFTLRFLISDQEHDPAKEHRTSKATP